MSNFEIFEAYQRLLKNEQLSTPLVAILALTEMIEQSRAGTMFQLVKELKDGAGELNSKSPNSISLNAGCELFIEFITLFPHASASFEDLKKELIRQGRQYAEEALTYRAKIAELAFDFIKDDSVILTHSYSRVVMQTLLMAHKRKRISVFVTEARPRGLGIKTAEELQAVGIPCSVVLDSAVAYAIEKVDFVLVGSEAVVESGGLINAVGSNQMAIIAKAANKPFYALAESYKFHRLFPLSQYDLPTQKTHLLSFTQPRQPGTNPTDSESAKITQEQIAQNNPDVDYTRSRAKTAIAVTDGPQDRFLYELARGVEFLFRLGTSLKLPSPALFTAATWFHRFYLRYSMPEFHRQDVAASCIFLATKTEECGRKLRDVAKVYHSKAMGIDVMDIPSDSKDVDALQADILLVEEYLLEALCFDLTVESPHAHLVDLFSVAPDDTIVQDYAWTIAHDSYRTPLCILFKPQIIAAACYILAQCIVDGSNSLSLDARISNSAPSASLPTPPRIASSPDVSRLAVEYFAFNERDLCTLGDALSILLEFYSAQDETAYPYLASVVSIRPPSSISSIRRGFYTSFTQEGAGSHRHPVTTISERTPSSSHGGNTPIADTLV
ncbi:hypothetical protein D9758_003304 [Tetrapyrgos nigripes]|uniref:Translation initiation factor eIF2B subunit alpha n=1 Tax=Tetrapyrgos nigripes TaxID=182062 RepID=A0A8H5LQF4_9AGAR|nr:hypothetical protein D9758_003304 [Tetrapyrgos nigripes]